MDMRLQYMNVMPNALSQTATGSMYTLVHIFSQLLGIAESEGNAND
jgi:hypothetical protein